MIFLAPESKLNLPLRTGPLASARRRKHVPNKKSTNDTPARGKGKGTGPFKSSSVIQNKLYADVVSSDQQYIPPVKPNGNTDG